MKERQRKKRLQKAHVVQAIRNSNLSEEKKTQELRKLGVKA